MKNELAMLFLGAAGFLSIATELPAQPANCASRDVVLEQLDDRFNEIRQSIGLAGNNTVVEFFVNPVTQSWTVTMTYPSGQTCVMAAGTGFDTIAQSVHDPDDRV